MLPIKRVAIIGLGEVGRCIAAAVGKVDDWVAELCEQVPRGEAIQLAGTLNRPIRSEPGDWLSGCDLVLSAVSGTASEDVAMAVAAWLRPGLCYVDLSTARPESLARSAAFCEKQGVDFIDGAIMGSIALTGIRTPILLSGPAAEAGARLLEALGFRCSTLPSSRPGDASSLKLLRSLFTKGLEALTVETLLVAEAKGLRDRLLEQLAVIDEAPFANYLSILVTSHVVHACRRLAEVEAARDELLRDGFDLASIEATIQRFRVTALRLDAEQPPAEATVELAGALAWLSSGFAERAAIVPNKKEGGDHE